MRHWTHEEATAALPDVREQGAADPRARPRATDRERVGRAPRLRDRTPIGELQADGIIVRDPGRGLIDFPALAPSGETYLLCWLDGEDAIEWWHWPDAGFAGAHADGHAAGVSASASVGVGHAGALGVRERGADDPGLVEQLRGHDLGVQVEIGGGTCPPSC